jgi:hypothetical protein
MLLASGHSNTQKKEKDILKYGGRIASKGIQTILSATKNVSESRKSLANAKIVLGRH